MPERQRMRRLGRWYLPVLGGVYAAAALGVVALVNAHDRAMAVRAADEKARLLLQRNEAAARYVSDELVPAVRRVAGDAIRPDTFDPVWMSSFYMVRRLDEYVVAGGERYVSRKVARGARVPSNEADPLERAFLEEAARDPSVTARSVEREIDGEPWLQVLVAGQAMDASCLRCHDTPDGAPAALVERYGPERSFGRRAGDVFHARSVRMPLADAYAAANAFSLKLSAALLGILAALFAAQWAVGRRFLLSREHLAQAVEERTRELEVAQQRLALADRLASIGTMAAGVAHEINNPLSYVLANVGYLAGELAGPDPLDRQRDDLLRAARDAGEGAARVRGIVQGLRSFARAPQGDQRPVDLVPELGAAVAMCRHDVELRARFETRIPSTLPLVAAREHELEQLFVNLLVNAVQALPPDRAHAENRVCISARAEGAAGVVVEVEDNGVGIAPEVLPRVFDPFFTTKPVGQGTGLGLSICHGIARRSGGTIEVESTPGEGARFRVVLPAAAAPEALSGAAAAAPRTAARP
ncbi:MAG TPA: ATP-binding protein [Anaeromyxobacteraceae bacterium]|nr:ATP-binding protein [Anaeromyxobacteraceae bacterium]